MPNDYSRGFLAGLQKGLAMIDEMHPPRARRQPRPAAAKLGPTQKQHWKRAGLLPDKRRLKDNKGSIAVEAAFLMPVFVLLVLGGLQLAIMYEQRQATNYTAQSCATSASRALTNKQDPNAAGVAVVNANASMLINGATFSPPTISQPGGGAVTCAVVASGKPLISIFGSGNVTTSASATD